MIIKDKNKLKLGARSKILVLGLILITLVGIFIPITSVLAQDAILDNLTIDGASQDATTDRCASVEGIGNIICKVNQILQSIVPLLVALGLVYFLWGVVQYVIGTEAETKK